MAYIGRSFQFRKSIGIGEGIVLNSLVYLTLLSQGGVGESTTASEESFESAIFTLEKNKANKRHDRRHFDVTAYPKGEIAMTQL